MSHVRSFGTCIPAHHAVSRRGFLSEGAVRAAGAVTVAGCFASDMGQIHALRSEEVASELRNQDKRVILLWLAGGASQFETWDPKPGAKTGGPFRAIQTNATGVHISELLPELSQRMHHTAIIRSLNTKIADHGGGADLVETGRLKDPGILYPDLGAVVARELGLELSWFGFEKAHLQPLLSTYLKQNTNL
ncbi:MAG: DUF1501 domain-containing protein, partial [Planctomycetota bacterium]